MRDPISSWVWEYFELSGAGAVFPSFSILRAEGILGTEQVLVEWTNPYTQFSPMKVTSDIIFLDVGLVEQLQILWS